MPSTSAACCHDFGPSPPVKRWVAASKTGWSGWSMPLSGALPVASVDLFGLMNIAQTVGEAGLGVKEHPAEQGRGAGQEQANACGVAWGHSGSSFRSSSRVAAAPVPCKSGSPSGTGRFINHAGSCSVASAQRADLLYRLWLGRQSEMLGRLRRNDRRPIACLRRPRPAPRRPPALRRSGGSARRSRRCAPGFKAASAAGRISTSS